MWIQKITNLYRQIIPQGFATVEKYIPYCDNDQWPLIWSKTISDSPSGRACVSTIADFLEGFGFSDTDLENIIVNNQGETFFQIHQQTCKSFAEFEGFYWLFRYGGAGEITEWLVLPFENCRLGKPDDNGYISKILYNPFFGTADYNSSAKKETKAYDVYNPQAVREQYEKQGNEYKGQVFFFGTTSPLSRYYPMPEAVSARKWMKIEDGVSDYHEDNIENGFMQPYITVMYGNPNEPSTNPANLTLPEGEKITVGQEFNDLIAENFAGAKRVGSMWVHWVNNPNEKPEVIALPGNNTGDMFITLDNQATKKITVGWKVPSILANIHEGVSLGGDGNTMRVAVKLMQQRVVKKQRILTDAYSKIWRQFPRPYIDPITIVPYNPYPELEVLDDKIWDELTPEERRKWIQENTDIEILEEDEPLITQPTIPENKFRNALPVGFPEKVKNNVKKALDYQDKIGLKCSSRMGRMVSEQIMNNSPMPMRQIRRIHNFLKRNAEFENKLFNEGCGAVLYQAWGGKEMFDFLENKLKEIDQWLN